MKTLTFALASAALILSACDNAKPRPPADAAAPVATTAPAADVAPPPEAMSTGLAKRDEFPGFYLDHVGQALDPLNKQPAVTAAGVPTVLDGFGFDPVAKLPAKGVDVVIDGKAYGATYGSPRDDVATFNKNPALSKVGYTTTLPASALSAGPHVAQVRVIAVDGKGYFESPQIAFTVK